MAQENSIFHVLQREGERALKVDDVKSGYDLSLRPFIEKISGRPGDPFPIYRVPFNTHTAISHRFYQVMAIEGLSVTEDMPEPDLRAAAELLGEETFNAALPSRRFSVETLDPNNNHFGMVFEAMRAIDSPYSQEEVGGKKIKDINLFRIHLVLPVERLRASSTPVNFPSKFRLFNMSLYYSIPKSIGRKDGANIQLAALAEDSFRLEKKPRGSQPTKTDDLFDLPPSSFYKEIADAVVPHTTIGLELLWVLSRDPKVVTIESKGFSAENRARRDRGQPQLSPIRNILVDEQELRRLEAHRADEIAAAFANKGGYKIPGLVLVDEYKRDGDTKLVQAYARCADDAVRREATELMRQSVRDYDKIAELVNSFGACATKARYTQSTIFVPRIAKGP